MSFIKNQNNIIPNSHQKKMRHFEGLDVLRAFAVFFVIITHWGPAEFSSKLFTQIYQKILPNGNFGVDLFFVLSGYLITRILINARIKSEEESKLKIIKAFYIRRSLRIFPAYFLLIILVLILGDKDVFKHLLYYLTYTSNFLVFQTKNWNSISHTWSLAVEEQFYILWPWIIIYFPKRYLLKSILTFFFVGIISSLLLYQFYGNFFYVLTPTCFTAFTLGALWSYIEFFPNDKIIKLVKLAFPISIILFVVSQFGQQLVLIRLVNSVIALNLIIYVTADNYNKLTAFVLKNKILISLGRISYGIYLYHFITPSYYQQLINFLNQYAHFSDKNLKILLYPPPAYLIKLGIVFFISFISFKYFESYFTNLKKHFRYVPSESSKVAV
jgi:peptidoglycan/LPS O-acetylase OafA/YrhL